MIILDTDIMIDMLRQYPNALNWLAIIDEEEIALPGFVVFELLMGCRNKAVELNMPLYTFNEKHYSIISLLKTIRPYKKDISKA
ncbi:MAG TPA: PIN domain-containing protein [Candidatus Eremiobacteraeota bacterium]|nr:MAG: hypothetical protein BWY64_02354 [bacterium ADurb.Bin363]HPZ08802.1 PIN domain-containing protein [Candidatus Eremiobacteraeota bacterium]